MTVSAWAQPADVLTLTGITVTDAVVLQAQTSIEVLTGRTFVTPSTSLSVRDLYWLKTAVAYQAAWLPQQVDLYSKAELSNISQDGMNITYDPATAGKALVCAPMARRAMRRLSWMGSRSLHTHPVGASRRSTTSADYDGEQWQRA